MTGNFSATANLFSKNINYRQVIYRTKYGNYGAETINILINRLQIKKIQYKFGQKFINTNEIITFAQIFKKHNYGTKKRKVTQRFR
jgi:hypothetical protein